MKAVSILVLSYGSLSCVLFRICIRKLTIKNMADNCSWTMFNLKWREKYINIMLW